MEKLDDIIKRIVDLDHAFLTEDGREVLSQKPVAVSVDFEKPVCLQDQVRRLLRQELSQHAAAAGRESWEEANDFDVDDDLGGPDDVFAPNTQYVELDSDPAMPPTGDEGDDSPAADDDPPAVADPAPGGGTGGAAEKKLDTV